MAVFKCGNITRRDEDDNPVCDYSAPQRWSGICPKCKRNYGKIKVGLERGGRKLSSAAQSVDPGIQAKHIATGIDGFDQLTNGGIVESQSILLAGPAGSRKTSLMLMVLDQLTKNTTRPLLIASAEQNDKDVLMFCDMLGIKNDKLKIMGNASHIEDVLSICDELRPLMLVLDSLQAISSSSGQPSHEIARRFAKYCKGKKMCGVAINHMNKALDITGSTGAAHYVDTVLAFEPFFPDIDGDPAKLFGEAVLREHQIHYNRKDPGEKIDNLRILKSIIKNRYGSIGQQAYYFTAKDGKIVPLEKKSNVLLYTKD